MSDARHDEIERVAAELARLLNELPEPERAIAAVRAARAMGLEPSKKGGTDLRDFGN